ncbi:hypothetical protein G9A89_009305 [Geosiphon pyriformis]|nr:hypothetical protein G9A89_009305 [Geosiphon pyriformis]
MILSSTTTKYENRSNNPTTAQDKSTINKKPRFFFPTILSYYQTSQSRIVFNPPPETQNLTPTAGQTKRNMSTWKQPPAQNPAESASSLMKGTAILQPIGSSNKEKQLALASREHSNMQTLFPLIITSNTPPINWIMAYRDITKLEKFSDDDHTIQALLFFLTRTANLWYQNLAEKPISFTEFKLTFLQYFYSYNLCHPANLQEAVTFTRDFKSTEQEVNHTQAVNLAINRTFDIDTKITQLKLTNHHNKEKITTTADIHSNKTISNSNNLGDPILVTVTTARNLNILPILAKHGIPIFHLLKSTPSVCTTSPVYLISRNSNNNQVQTNSELSQPISRAPTGYPNQASYLGLMKDQNFDKSINILPVIITEDTTLATIFLFNIDNLNTHRLFSGAVINQDKSITVLYINAKVRGIDIKLILDSGSASSIITKQLMDQLVPATYRHFKTQHTEEPLIEFEDTSLPLIIEIYQILWADDYQTELLPLPIWKEKGKGRAKEESQSLSLGYVTSDQRNLFYQPPKLICVNCGKKLSIMGACIRNNKKWPIATKYYYNTPCLACDEILPNKRLWNNVPGRERTCDKVCQYTILINNWMVIHMIITKSEEWQVLKLKALHNLFTDDSDQEQQLVNLNTKLCNYYLISCYFQYCNKCDLMFNPSSRILYLITKLSEPKEKEKLLAKNIDNDKKICPEKAHETGTGFDLRYSGQSSIVIALYSLVKIDLKIVLEIPVSIIIQVAFRLSLAKKEINIKEEIIDVRYTKNIIVMLQNNLDKPYKIKSHEKIAQAIFLSLVKIPQLALITTQEELGLTV